MISCNRNEINVPVEAQLIVSPDTLFMTKGETKTVIITQQPAVDIHHWEISTKPDWIEVTPSTGQIKKSKGPVTITLDTTKLTGEQQKGVVEFVTDGAGVAQLVVTVESADLNNPNNPNIETGLIPAAASADVIDAEYSRSKDIIVTVTTSPYELRKLNTQNNTVEILPLHNIPSTVSVSKDGNYAAVAYNSPTIHSGSFAYINLNTMSIEKTYHVPTGISTILLAPNGWVYMFQTGNQTSVFHHRMYGVELATGYAVAHTGKVVAPNMNPILDKTEKYIYSAVDTGVKTNIDKFSIEEGAPEFRYSCPEYNRHPTGHYAWLNDTQTLLFGSSKNIFTASTSQSADMYLYGKLEGPGIIRAFDYSDNAGKIYTVNTLTSSLHSPPTNIVRRHNTDLSFEGETVLPNITTGTGSYRALGHYGFFNNAGTKYYVIAQAENPSITNAWKIITLNVE
jgi:hypothetical protein